MDFASSTALSPEVHETHTGLVVLVGDRAYKCKKGVVTPFLDFSTVQLRERACAREIELNSRLAPSAYLGLAHLSGPQPGAVEPVVVMRRYPDTLRLSTRVRASDAGTEELAGQISAVARTLAAFHAGAHRGVEVDEQGGIPAVTRRWQANIDEMRPLGGSILSVDLLDEVADLASRYCAGRAALFESRIAQGRIVDGHADLLADDIFCTDDGPVLLDCLDFDDRLRYVDGIDDAACLAMDLEFLGREDLAAGFVDDYRAAAGDPAPPSLADFYIAYRAGMRAKVDCIRFTQGDAEAAGCAQRHLQMAVDRLRAATIRLVLVGGGPGTGKTTLSRALAERIGARVISTDDVRRELLSIGTIAGAAGVIDAGRYTPENVAAVYDEVLHRADGLLAAGQSVIVDGTWRDADTRRKARELARLRYSRITELRCVTSLVAAQDRIAHRIGGTSDATGEVAVAFAGRADGWDDAHHIDTGRPLAAVLDEAEQLCGVSRTGRCCPRPAAASGD